MSKTFPEIIHEAVTCYQENGYISDQIKADFVQEIGLHRNYEMIEVFFQKMIELNPQERKLKQALAMNKILKDGNKVHGAVEVLKSLVETEPISYNVFMQYYVFSGILFGHFSEKTFEQLYGLDQCRTEKFLSDFTFLEFLRDRQVAHEVKVYKPNHVFILLGCALDSNGQMTEMLLGRLHLAKELLEKNPYSTIIVSGGVPKNERSEAGEMKKWLIANGIAEERIEVECRSIDTYWNAYYSLQMVAEGNHITVVTSECHVRRALMIFTMVDRVENKGRAMNRKIDAIAALDDSNLLTSSDQIERVQMYYDLLRIGDIWQYPDFLK